MRVVVTGGAGYLGSVLTNLLLRQGHEVLVLDALRYGGPSLPGFLHHPNFTFVHADIRQKRELYAALQAAEAVVHMAAVVGYPACKQEREGEVRSINENGVKVVFDAAEKAGCKRFIFASTYSNYGICPKGEVLNEDSPLQPQSLYAETKIAAERFLLHQAGNGARCAPIVFRFATAMGISPRMRFDLMVNQFALEAFQQRRLVLFQDTFQRCFAHVEDIAQGVLSALEAPIESVGAEVFNLGSQRAICTKRQLAERVAEAFPGTEIETRQVNPDGDMRDIRISFEKIESVLGFRSRYDIGQTVDELKRVLEAGIFPDPASVCYRNVKMKMTV